MKSRYVNGAPVYIVYTVQSTQAFNFKKIQKLQITIPRYLICVTYKTIQRLRELNQKGA